MGSIDQVFRATHGKLTAGLLVRGFNPIVAEEAVSIATLKATETWSKKTPNNPEAWLWVVAKRAAIDLVRAQSKNISLDEINQEPMLITEYEEISDERLRLYFLCTHPAIDESVQVPLMLQMINGLSVIEIGKLFLENPTTIGQRLVRAKKKVRDAGISVDLPNVHDIGNRSEAVRNAIYGLYCIGWEDHGAIPVNLIADEAKELALVLARLSPSEPENLGLLALILFCESRRKARKSVLGTYVPLDTQDSENWNKAMIQDAEAILNNASIFGQIGRFQLEAAIQSSHVSRKLTGQPGLDTILQLYDGLLRFAPTFGNALGRIAVLAQYKGAKLALQELGKIQPDESYQPYWALKADLHAKVGEIDQAIKAYDKAIGLSTDLSVSEFLKLKKSQQIN